MVFIPQGSFTMGPSGLFEGIITLKVHNVAFLKELTKKLEKVKSITSITRTYKH